MKVAQWPASLVARCKTLSQNKKKVGEIHHSIVDVLKSSFALFRDGRIKRVHEKLNSSNLCVHLFRD